MTEFKRGVLAAANVAATYNGSTTHPFRLDDCIACKLNVVKRSKPRRNRQKIQKPDEAWIAGFAVALAEIHRLRDSRDVREVASAAGITLASARASGVSAFDLRELRRAGVG